MNQRARDAWRRVREQKAKEERSGCLGCGAPWPGADTEDVVGWIEGGTMENEREAAFCVCPDCKGEFLRVMTPASAAALGQAIDPDHCSICAEIVRSRG